MIKNEMVEHTGGEHNKVHKKYLQRDSTGEKQ